MVSPDVKRDSSAGFFLAAAGMILPVIGLVAMLAGAPAIWHPAAALGATAFAASLRYSRRFCGCQFTAWIIAVVTAALIYPAQFLHPAGLDMRNQWVMLSAIQMVMFGMGTQMRLHDFWGVVRCPRGVFVGIFCHFSVMPLVGWGLTKVFHFPPEIAAGVILIGSCSSGLASNVMAYLARSNLALSVTVTAVTTVLAPVMTPLWMKLLAGTLVHVGFFSMMMDIVRIMVVPIGAALLSDYLRTAASTGRRIVQGVALLASVWFLALAAGLWRVLPTVLSENSLTVIGLAGFLLSAFVIGVTYHALTARWPGIQRAMPVLAIVGILYVTAMTTAAGRDNLLKVGALLFLVSALHNLAGYLAGYFLSRFAGLERNCARSIAFEVGLQNGGMASGLASAMGKLGTVGLAAAIFIPWMNVSGSLLANYWSKRPVK